MTGGRRRRRALRVLAWGVGSLVLVMVLALGALAVHWWATLYRPVDADPPPTALTHATVLVGEDLRPLTDATVLVDRGRIVAVGTAVAVPAGTRTIDLTGRTVIPGLIDLHVHLGSPDLARGERVGPTRIPGIIYDAVRYAPGARRALLDHGVTTVRSLGDENQWILEARQMLRDGEIEGPRVLTSGPLFTTRGGHPVATFGVEPTSDAVRLPTTPAQARRDVADLLRGSGNHDGVDLIKVVQERGGPRKELDPLPPDVLAAIVAGAHAHGARVTAHWGTAEDLSDLITAGVDGLEHVEIRGVADGWPAGAVETLVDRGTPLTPTLTVTEQAVPAQTHATLRRRVAEFHQAGGRVVVGSDAGMPGVGFGRGVHRELELLVSSGLTPQAALRAATSEAARVLGEDDLGSVAPGRVADLVVLDGDPSRDIGAVRRVVMVVHDGRLVVDRRPR